MALKTEIKSGEVTAHVLPGVVSVKLGDETVNVTVPINVESPAVESRIQFKATYEPLPGGSRVCHAVLIPAEKKK